MRYIKMVTGSSVSDEAFSTKNKIWALVALSGWGLSVCSSFMALRPMGVAALSSPRPLAAKFSVISPSAGCPRGTSGISLANNGPSTLASHCTTPASSAMRKKPSHSVSVPNSSTMTSTDNLAMANSACTICANTCGCPPTSHWASAATAATRKKPNQSALSIGVNQLKS